MYSVPASAGYSDTLLFLVSTPLWIAEQIWWGRGVDCRGTRSSTTLCCTHHTCFCVCKMKPTSESNFAVMIISSALPVMCSGVPHTGKTYAYAVFTLLIEDIEKSPSCFVSLPMFWLSCTVQQDLLQLLEVCCYILLILWAHSSHRVSVKLSKIRYSEPELCGKMSAARTVPDIVVTMDSVTEVVENTRNLSLARERDTVRSILVSDWSRLWVFWQQYSPLIGPGTGHGRGPSRCLAAPCHRGAPPSWSWS